MINIQPNMIKVTDIKQVSENDKLFYELGYKINHELGYGDNWVLTGKFIEVPNPMTYIKEDKFLSNPDYLNHHNFMLIKG